MRRYALPVMLGIICSVMLAGCQSFGKKLEFNKGELYYTDSVTEAEANKLGEYLVKGEFSTAKRRRCKSTKRAARISFAWWSARISETTKAFSTTRKLFATSFQSTSSVTLPSKFTSAMNG